MKNNNFQLGSCKGCPYNFRLLLLLATFILYGCNCHDAPPPATLSSQVATTQGAPLPFNVPEPTGNAQIDSLLQLAAVAPHDTTLANLYHETGQMYKNTDPEKAKAYFRKLGTLSE